MSSEAQVDIVARDFESPAAANMLFVLAPAGRGDLGAIAEVHIQAWRAAYRGLVPDAVLDQRSIESCEDLWRDALASGEPALLLARSGDDCVGFIAYGAARDDDAGPRCAEIWTLYLHPDHWGRGLGRQLWQAACQALVDKGIDTVFLWVVTGNHRAIAFYHAMGCHAENRFKQVQRGEVRLHEQRYRYDIGHPSP